MAKPKGVFQVEGKLEDFSFYDSVYGRIVRRKGGPTARQIANSKKFVRVREHNSEFRNCVLAGKRLRHALWPLLKVVKDHRLVWRVNQLMNALKKLDTVSPRGERHALQGLASEAGKQVLKGFDFNSQSELNVALKADLTLDTTSGTLRLKQLKPGQDLKAPSGATHASFKSGWLRTDLGEGKPELLESEEVLLQLRGKAGDVVLAPEGKPKGSGIDIFLLQVSFLQEINGSLYPLNNGAFTALGVVGVEGGD